MRKLMVATAAAGSLLMVGATAGTAAAASEPYVEPWTASVTGASGSGNLTSVSGVDMNTSVKLDGKLTVTDTDPKACYSVTVGFWFSKMKWWYHAPQKQCGPGTVDLTNSFNTMSYFDAFVIICKEGEWKAGCKA
ncbi:hypothetical protein ACWEPM_30605 [Streptomyces sp. NPDC004244]